MLWYWITQILCFYIYPKHSSAILFSFCVHSTSKSSSELLTWKLDAIAINYIFNPKAKKKNVTGHRLRTFYWVVLTPVFSIVFCQVTKTIDFGCLWEYFLFLWPFLRLVTFNNIKQFSNFNNVNHLGFIIMTLHPLRWGGYICNRELLLGNISHPFWLKGTR